MFSGIVQTVGKIESIKDKNNIKTIRIETHGDYLKDIAIGQSVSVDGVCLSLVKKNNEYCEFEAVEETINRTTLGSYKQGSKVNLEKSLKVGDELGGHFVYGHVDTTANVLSIKKVDKSYIFDFEINRRDRKDIIEKASICVNGISLTISKVTKKGFQIWVIPHTFKLTNLSKVRKGSLVNIEIDILSKYVKK